MEDPTLGSWYVGNKILSCKSVVFVRNPVGNRVWSLLRLDELGASLCR
jgi:hypothetical protein